MSKIVAIHQPVYLPWLGFFKKMMDCDTFVLYDDAQFRHKNFQNRNTILTSNGPIWLTVPVNAHQKSKNNEVKIDNTKNWTHKHKRSILTNYTRATYFEKYKKFIDELYDKNFDLLLDINIEIIKFVMQELNIKTKIIFSSELDIHDTGSDKVLNICKAVGAELYISGTAWAKDNLKINDFQKNNIKVELRNFVHPTYKQCHEPFTPNMSIIDLLFNEGINSEHILRNAKTEKV